MKNTSLSILSCATFLLFSSSLESSESTSSQKTNQDFQAAEKYFQDELEFTSNPYGVKMALEGKKGKMKIIDVRSRDAFAKGHIPGAINIPYEEIDQMKPTENLDLMPIKDGHNYVYCYENLCNLSQKACLKLASLGYPVKEMKGGFTGWTDHKYPVEK